MPNVAPSPNTFGVECAERRRFKRIPVLRPVLYITEKFGETPSHILDLSVGGAYIESPVVPEGTAIELEFPLVNGYRVRARAIVRHVMLGAGMGVEFEELSDEAFEQIAALVSSFHVPVSTRAG